MSHLTQINSAKLDTICIFRLISYISSIISYVPWTELMCRIPCVCLNGSYKKWLIDTCINAKIYLSYHGAIPLITQCKMLTATLHACFWSCLEIRIVLVLIKRLREYTLMLHFVIDYILQGIAQSDPPWISHHYEIAWNHISWLFLEGAHGWYRIILTK